MSVTTDCGPEKGLLDACTAPHVATAYLDDDITLVESGQSQLDHCAGRYELAK